MLLRRCFWCGRCLTESKSCIQRSRKTYARQPCTAAWRFCDLREQAKPPSMMSLLPYRTSRYGYTYASSLSSPSAPRSSAIYVLGEKPPTKSGGRGGVGCARWYGRTDRQIHRAATDRGAALWSVQFFYRATHVQRICIARYMLWFRVCPSVRPSEAGVLSKRLYGLSCFFGTDDIRSAYPSLQYTYKNNATCLWSLVPVSGLSRSFCLLVTARRPSQVLSTSSKVASLSHASAHLCLQYAYGRYMPYSVALFVWPVQCLNCSLSVINSTGWPILCIGCKLIL